MVVSYCQLVMKHFTLMSMHSMQWDLFSLLVEKKSVWLRKPSLTENKLDHTQRFTSEFCCRKPKHIKTLKLKAEFWIRHND